MLLQHKQSVRHKKFKIFTVITILKALKVLIDDDDQPKLTGSGVVVTLVCEYTRDPEGI